MQRDQSVPWMPQELNTNPVNSGHVTALQKRSHSASWETGSPTMPQRINPRPAMPGRSTTSSAMITRPASQTTHRHISGTLSKPYVNSLMGTSHLANDTGWRALSNADFFGSPAEYLAGRMDTDPGFATFDESLSIARKGDFSYPNLPLYQSNALPIQDVSPRTSISAASSFVPLSFLTGEDMSRQGSVTTGSLVNGFDMMHVESCFSQSSSDLPSSFENDFDTSGWPSIVNDLGEDAITGMDDKCASQLTSNIGSAFNLQDELSQCDAASFHVDLDQTAPRLDHGVTMERTSSSQSSSSTSSMRSNDARQRERRQRQIKNSRKPIAARRLQNGPLSGNRQRATTPPRPLQPLFGDLQRKEAIAKAPYKRPKHAKLLCKFCKEVPDGFRGEHELKRHCDRRHAKRPKVWICVDPQTPSYAGQRPLKSLESCDWCRSKKGYPVDYNAAAHLRRAHFSPSKRGRRPKGQEPEAKVDKRDSDKLSLEWLKCNGWLKKVEVAPPPMPTDFSSSSELASEVDAFAETEVFKNEIVDDEELVPYEEDEDDILYYQGLGFDPLPVDSDLDCSFLTPGIYSAAWPEAKPVDLHSGLQSSHPESCVSVSLYDQSPWVA